MSTDNMSTDKRSARNSAGSAVFSLRVHRGGYGRGDEYLALTDYRSHVDSQDAVDVTWRDIDRWTR